MKARFVSVATAVCLSALLFTLDLDETTATTSMLADFSNVYGSTIASRFGCEICHPAGGYTLNAYGQDLSNAAGFGCPDFSPPATHTILEFRGTCEALHAPGYRTPMSSNCVGCHGAALTGSGGAPSCYLCHDKLWQDGATNSCPDFNPPATHNITESTDSCEALHAPGYSVPLSSGCASCHGADLTGGSGPSCYICHGKVWKDSGSASCPDFSPPATHTILEELDACDAYHAPGYEVPMDSNCAGCHGSDLTGAGAPSCYLCHDKVWQDGSGGGDDCPDFDPPSDHNRYFEEDGCGAYHKQGWKNPLMNGCTDCHGADLKGGTGPSCFTCHDIEWNTHTSELALASLNTSHPASITAAQFKLIEGIDSDGDGYTNKEEIDALTNPGDKTSVPLGKNAFTVKMAEFWERSWMSKRGKLSVSIRSNSGIAVDNTKPITISVGKRSLTTTKIKNRAGGFVEARFQKALLHCLFKDLSVTKETVTIEGTLVDETAFIITGDISLMGAMPNKLKAVRARVNPKELSEITDIELILKGKDVDKIDLKSKLVSVGVRRHLRLTEVEEEDDILKISIEARDMERLFGDLVPGVTYTLGVRGSGVESNAIFCATVELTVPEDGDGGDNCLKFSPPGSHTVELMMGECGYMHAPGMTDPLGNGCGSCHGSDLKGSVIAPSCLLCHGEMW